MNAGIIIKLLRTANRISQEDLAERLGVTRPYLSSVENGRREPSLAFLRDVSREFEIPVALLLVDDEDENDSEVMRELRRLLRELLATKVTLWTPG